MPGVFVTYAREDGAGDAQRLVGVLERILGPGFATPAPADAAAASEAIERSEVVVALIGPRWRAADGDAMAAELTEAFARRIPVVAMLMHKASMPARDALPPALGPLLDNHPHLTLEMPAEFYWAVTTSHLGNWVRRIVEQNRRLERDRVAAAKRVQDVGRDLRQTRERLDEVTGQEAAAGRRREAAEAALAEAARLLEQRRGEAGAGRSGPGLRVFISYRPESGGDVRTLERDLRERLDGGRLSSSEPIPDRADPAAVAGERIARADAVLAIVGPRWAGGAGEPGLERADDPVKLELEAALARGLPVIPVLSQHASMPAAEALPESLRGLAGERFYELIVAFWDDGVADLVRRLDAIEADLRRREQALEEAVERQGRFDRELAAARADDAKAAAAIRDARDRIAGLEDQLRRATEEEEQLRRGHRDANPAYLEGPGPIGTVERQRDHRPLALSGRALLGGLGLIVLIVLIIVIAH